MLGLSAVQADEVLAIERQHSPTVSARKSKDVLVRDRLPGFAHFVNG